MKQPKSGAARTRARKLAAIALVTLFAAQPLLVRALPGEIDHFAWGAISSPQYTNIPFPTALFALDASNSIATNFNGVAMLSASTGEDGFSVDFETGLQGFTIDNTTGSGSGLWHLSSGRGSNAGHSSTTSLYYGHGEGPTGGGNYNTGGANGGSVISPPIVLPSGTVTLSFNYLVNVEPLVGYDRTFVEVSTNSGTSFVTVAGKGTGLSYNTGGSWVSNSVPLTQFAGKTILIRFRFDTVDAIANATEGWYLDDITIRPMTVDYFRLWPTNTGAFTNGTWNGDLTVLDRATNLLLTADDGAGHIGRSGLIQVFPPQMSPLILIQPSNAVVIAGKPVSFGVLADGTPPLAFLWALEGADLPAETNATLAINSVLPEQAGRYTVRVSNAFGTNISSEAMLTVLVPPTIATQPSSSTNVIGTTATFNVSAIGSPLLTYQWKKNGVALANGGRISGATNDTLSLASLQTGDAGSYAVVVTNVAGSITSAPAVLTILVPPTITTQPASRTNATGTVASFTVAVSGTSPISFQWKKNGVDLVNGGNVSGATTSTLTLSPVSYGDIATYSVLASNAAGTALSSNATLSLLYQSSIVAWGDNTYGQTNVPGTLLDAVRIASGPDSDFSLAVRFDHTVIGWGDNSWGQLNVPAGLKGIVAVAAGSGHGLALNSSGFVTAWGRDSEGQTDVPPGLSNVVAIAAGGFHSLALKVDGTVVGWGANEFGQTIPPMGLKNVIAIAAGYFHSLALKSDGTIAAWGNDEWGQTDVPSDLSNVVAIAAGDSHNLALHADGSVSGWGWNGEGELEFPVGLSNVVAVSAGYGHCMALLGNRKVVAWGANDANQTNTPDSLGDVAAIAAGQNHSVALIDQGPPFVWSMPSGVTADDGESVVVLSVTALGAFPQSWQWLKNGSVLSEGGSILGSTTSILTLTNPHSADSGNYSVTITNAFGTAVSLPVSVTVLAPSSPIISSQPASRTNVDGTSAGFSVAVHGTRPLAYQWMKNDVELWDSAEILGVTTANLVLSNVQDLSAGNYRVVITNVLGSVTSSPALLTVLDRVVITSAPVACTNLSGTTATFSVVATGTMPLQYQWRQNGAALQDGGKFSGTGTATLSISNVQFSNAGNYTVAIANAAGLTSSAPAILTVVGPPVITTPPASRSILSGTSGTFSVIAIGTGQLSYQWTFNGTDLPDQTNSTLTLDNVQDANAGAYAVVVTNAFGATLSASATLEVLMRTTITSQPVSRTNNAGTVATFTVVATGYATRYYTWEKNGYYLSDGGNVSGATTPTLVLNNVQDADMGLYNVYIQSDAGSLISSAATLVVNHAPAITLQPRTQTKAVGASVGFTVQVSGATPLSYQWLLNSVILPSQTNSTLNLTNLQFGDAGNYSVVITNRDGSATSSNATLTIHSASPCASAPQGLVSWWKGEFDTQDLAGANDGIAQGNVSYAAAEVGQGFSFSGAGSFVMIPASPSLDLGKNSGLTIEGWISPSAVNNQEPIVEWNNGAGAVGVHLWISQSGAGNGPGCLYANLKDDQGNAHYFSSAAGLVQADDFQHVALTYDHASGMGRLYLNGALVAEQNLGSFTPQTAYDCYLGQRPGTVGAYQWTGLLDEIALYGRALAGSEIQSIYDANSSGKCGSGIEPWIVRQPNQVQALAGLSSSFGVVSGGTAPLSYQWRKSGANLADGGNVAGATSATLTLTGMTEADAASYDVVISNAFGITVSSNISVSITYGTVVVAWGDDSMGQTNVPAILTNAVAISSGPDSHHSLALRPDGMVVAWGANDFGQLNAPASLTGVAAIAAGGMHSLALRTNGQVAAWGRNDEGQTNVPLDLNGVIAIAAGNTHSLAIKSNGTVAAWGDNSSGQCDVPAGLTNVTAVTAGFNHSVALKSDGTVVAWGDNTYGQLEVPVGLSNIIAIAAGDSHTLAVKADGSGVGWGWDGDGETDFPAGATNLVAVAGGYSHSMALREDGTVVCWGWNPEGEATVPSGLGNVAAISAGTSYSMALLNANWPVILKQPANVSLENGGTLLLKVSAVGAPTLRFQWQRNGVDLADGAGVSGSRTSTLTIVGVQPGKAGSYSVTVTNPAGAVTSRPATVSVLLAPSVRIRAQGNVLSLSWPAQPAGFVLEHSATLSPPQWVAVTNTTGSLGNETTCSIPMSATKDFYRLRFDGP